MENHQPFDIAGPTENTEEAIMFRRIILVLMVIPAIVAAYLLGYYATFETARVTYRSDVAAWDIRSIRIWAQTVLDDHPEIRFESYDQTDLWQHLGHHVDPWSNDYRVVELQRTGTLGSKSTFHVYSLGADGKSESGGNDPDDINSWNYDRDNFYGPSIAKAANRQLFFRTLLLAPLLYALFYCCFSLAPKSPRKQLPNEVEFNES